MPQTTNNIELPVVDYDTAVMLKEVGFDVPCLRYINAHYKKPRVLKSFIYGEWNNRSDKTYSAPELALVQMWLLTIHELHISTRIRFANKTFWYKITDLNNLSKDVAVEGEFESEPKALTAAIKHACSLIKEKK